MRGIAVSTAIVAALLSAAPAGAQDEKGVLAEGQWYVSPMASYVFDDEDRQSDPGPGLHIGIGRSILDRWAIEFNAVSAHLDGFNEVQQWGIGIDMLGFGRGDKIRPFVLIGTGYLKSQFKEGNRQVPFEDGDNLMGSVGGGALIDLGKFPGMLRSEVRLRADFADPSTYLDWVVSAGLMIPFGSGAPAALLPDSDRDGVADPADQCPGTPPGSPVDAVGCEFDTDGDGVIDRFDKCPNTPRGTPVDNDGCPIPAAPAGPLDSDGDGVPDDRDECPNTRAGARVDHRGCEITDEIKLPGVNFEFNSATITPSSLGVLNGAVSTLERYPDIDVECAGHTDSLGADGYNEALSQRRAESVCSYLASRGIADSRLQSKGYGESSPIADNETEEGRAENRRVTLRITN